MKHNDVTLSLPARLPDPRFALAVNGVPISHVTALSLHHRDGETEVTVSFIANINAAG